MSLFILSLPLILEYTEIEFVGNLIKNNYFLIALTFVLSYLMNSELHLFSLKFKEYSFKKNIVKYIFLLSSLLLILTIHFLSIPIIIIFYLTLSLIKK
jgi:CDP-diacylglycerol--serine O-phosphatidyltransferase